MTGDQPAEGKRSKRIYIYWGIALSLLIAAGLLSWLVVVPVLQTRAVVNAFWMRNATLASRLVANDEEAAAAIEQLGGQERAVSRIKLYLRAPECMAKRRLVATVLLGYCGDSALPVLEGLLRNEDGSVRQAAANALRKIRGERPEKGGAAGPKPGERAP